MHDRALRCGATAPESAHQNPARSQSHIYQPLRWLLQLLRGLSERRTALRKQVAKMSPLATDGSRAAGFHSQLGKVSYTLPISSPAMMSLARSSTGFFGRFSSMIMTMAGLDMKNLSHHPLNSGGWRHPHPPPEEQFAGRPGQMPSFKLLANNKTSPKFNVCRFAHHSDHHTARRLPCPWGKIHF
jgi:hypothetical protein